MTDHKDLFQPDNFSKSEVKFVALESQQEASLRSLIQEHYALGDVEKIEAIDAIGINSGNWRVDTSEGVYALKKYSHAVNPGWKTQMEWVAKSREMGIPVPHLLHNNSNKFETEYPGHFFCISEFVSGDRFSGNEQQWDSFTHTLSQLLNHARKGVSQKVKPDFPSRTFFDHDDEATFRWFENHFNKPELISPEEKDDLRTTFYEAHEVYRSGRQGREQCVFHIDLHPHNLIFEDDELKLVADFDSFKMTSLEVSLGFGLFKCMRQAVEFAQRQTAEMDSHISSLLDVSKRNLPQLPLTDLLSAGRWDVLKRLLSILKGHKNEGKSPWDKDIRKHVTALKEIKYILERV